MRGWRGNRGGRGRGIDNRHNNNNALPPSTPQGPAADRAHAQPHPRGPGGFGGTTFGRLPVGGSANPNRGASDGNGNLPTGGIPSSSAGGVSSSPSGLSGSGEPRYELEFDPSVYYPPQNHVDMVDLPAGTGMGYHEVCLNCYSTVVAGHLLLDGSCPRRCVHCKTSDHLGSTCPRLWLSKSFYKKHGQRRVVPPNAQIRPSPLDCAELIRLGHPFFGSVRNAAYVRNMPRTRPAVPAMPTVPAVPTYQQLPEDPIPKRVKREEDQAVPNLEMQLQVEKRLREETQRLREDEMRMRIRAEGEVQRMQRELDELKSQLAAQQARSRSPARSTGGVVKAEADEPRLGRSIKRELDE